MAVADIDPDQHRAAGIVANNSIWDLVGEPASPERDEALKAQERCCVGAACSVAEAPS